MNNINIPISVRLTAREKEQQPELACTADGTEAKSGSTRSETVWVYLLMLTTTNWTTWETLTTQNDHTCEHPGQDWTGAHCMSASFRPHLHLLTPAEDRQAHFWIGWQVGTPLTLEAKGRCHLAIYLREFREWRGMVRGSEPWGHLSEHWRWCIPDGRTHKGSGTSMGEIWSEHLDTQGTYTERAGKSCCINYSTNGRQMPGADSSLHWVQLWESESRVNTQFLINNTHISVSKLSTCACLCNIK